MRKRPTRLCQVLRAAAVFLAALLLLSPFAAQTIRADENEPAQTEPAVPTISNLRVRVGPAYATAVESTADAVASFPAGTSLGYCRLFFDYENFDPNKQYTAFVVVYRLNDGVLDFFDASIAMEQRFNVSGTNRSFSAFLLNYAHLWRNMKAGQYFMYLEIDDGSTKPVVLTQFSPETSFIISGISDSCVVLNDRYTSGSFALASADQQDLSAGLKISSRITGLSLLDQASYLVNCSLYRANEDGTNTLVYESGDMEAAPLTDTRMDVDVLTTHDLAPGIYFLTTEVKSEAGGVYYSVDTDSVTFRHQFEVTETHPRTEVTPSLALVRIEKLGENDQPLPGAKLRLLVGDTEIDSWVSSEEPHELRLAPGDYTLREEEAPEGYLTADDMVFTVTDDQLVYDGRLFTGSPKPIVTDELTSAMSTFTITPYGEDAEGPSGYCFYLGKLDPTAKDFYSDGDLLYKEVPATPEDLYANYEGDSLTAEEFYSGIRKTIYNGYPTNASGIQERFGLSDELFMAVTQDVIWHYTNEAIPGERYNPVDRTLYMQAYEALLAVEDQVPEDENIVLYRPSNGNYQGVLISQLRKASGTQITLRNARIPEEETEEPGGEPPEEPKKDEPEEPEVPEDEVVDPEEPPTDSEELPEQETPVDEPAPRAITPSKPRPTQAVERSATAPKTGDAGASLSLLAAVFASSGLLFLLLCKQRRNRK